MTDLPMQRNRWLIAFACSLCVMVPFLNVTLVNIGLPTIQRDIGASQSSMQWVVNAYALAYAALLITGGVLGDRIGRRRMMLAGLVLFGISAAVCAIATNVEQLIALNAVMGASAALLQPQTLSILVNRFPAGERAKAIGIWAAGGGLATAIGPVTGGALIEHFWWGSLFLVQIVFVAVTTVVVLVVLPESRAVSPARIDVLALVLSVAGLAALVDGITRGGDTNDWTRWNTLGSILAGVVLLGLFALVRRSRRDAVEATLFGNRRFFAGTITTSLAYLTLVSAIFILAFYLQAVRGHTPLETGYALLAIAGSVLVAAPAAGWLMERAGARTIGTTGLLLVCVALGLMASMDRTTAQWKLESAFVVFGAGLGLIMAVGSSVAMSAVALDQAAARTGVTESSRQVFGALGVAVLASILTLTFRDDLGKDAPARLAAQLDQPAAIVAQLPPAAQVSAQVDGNASESLVDALRFVGRAGDALQVRASLIPPGLGPPPEELAKARLAAEQAIGGFVDDSRDAFVDGMQVALWIAAGVALFAAALGLVTLPGRRDEAVLAVALPSIVTPQVASSGHLAP